MSDSAPIRVLHVDDDEDFVDMAGTYLQREDDRLDVTKATSAKEGLGELETSEYDCIVSDYEMPGTDGIEFLRTVRERDGEIPFILFTGRGSETVASEAISAGVTDYLQKEPGSEKYTLLANRIHNAVQGYRATKRAERLDRTRRVFGEISEVLVRAESRSEIQRRVCEILSGADPYLFAWIGTHDQETRTVQPVAAAGVESGYLDSVEITTDSTATGLGPTARAVRTREIAVVQDISTADDYDPWREPASERGYRSSAAVPLVDDGSLYGVLNVYAERAHAFDEDERELLAGLGEDVAIAIERCERHVHHRRCERIIENLPLGVYRATAGPEGELVEANPALADIFGADSPEEMVEHAASKFYVDPSERDELRERLEEDGVVRERELRQETLDGQEKWVSVTAIRTEEGDDVYFDGIISDITSARERESRLRLFREACESAGHSVYFTDAGGTIEYVNPAFEQTTGYSREEAIGANPCILKSGEHDRQFYEQLWDTILSGEVWRNEIVNQRADGERYVVDQTIAPVENRAGEIDHFVAINADITDQIERQRELKRKNERLEEFASVVSHDLRNPLNVAQGKLQLGRERGEEQHFETVERALERMGTLIEDLLTLTREGNETMSIESVDPARLVEECWETAETGDANLVVDVDTEIRADESRLRELLGNLFRNAFEHGGSDVTVTIGQLEDGFYVADDGPGIPENDRPDVLDRGYSTSEEGTGLGLHIVKRIAQEHGWDVEVTDSESGGARFEVTGVDSAVLEA